MPRQSAAALSVVRQFEPIRRPDPPQELTDEQAVEWREVVASMPADWFSRETFPLLTAYCKHIVTLRRVGELIDAEYAGAFDLERYDRLLKMQERESRAMSSLATRMRVSQNASYDKKKARPQQIPNTPWDKGPRGN